MIELYFSLICLAVLVGLGIFARHIIDSGIKVRRAYRLTERAEAAAARLKADGRELPRAAADTLVIAAQLSKDGHNEGNVFVSIDWLENETRHQRSGQLPLFEQHAHELARRSLGPGDPLKDLWFRAAIMDLEGRP